MDDELTEVIYGECDMHPDGKRWLVIVVSDLEVESHSRLTPDGDPCDLLSGTIGIQVMNETRTEDMFSWAFTINMDYSTLGEFPIALVHVQLEEYLALHLNLCHSYICKPSVLKDRSKHHREVASGVMSTLAARMQSIIHSK